MFSVLANGETFRETTMFPRLRGPLRTVSVSVRVWFHLPVESIKTSFARFPAENISNMESSLFD